ATMLAVLAATRRMDAVVERIVVMVHLVDVLVLDDVVVLHLVVRPHAPLPVVNRRLHDHRRRSHDDAAGHRPLHGAAGDQRRQHYHPPTLHHHPNPLGRPRPSPPELTTRR